MMNNSYKKENNLTVLQICSTVFPTGGFNHSFGLETYINNHKVKNRNDLLTVLKTYLNTQFIFNDGLGIRLLYEALKRNDNSFIYTLDKILCVSTLPKETREGYKKVGLRSVQCLLEIIPDCKELKDYLIAINNKKANGNVIVAYAIAFAYLDIQLEQAIEAFLFMNISNLVQNSVRAIPLGPSDGIYVLNAIKPFIISAIKKLYKYNIDSLGINGFGIEIAQMNHEDSLIRLFMS